jgi:hypothetical protein
MIRVRITKVSDWHHDYAAPHRFARPEHFMTLEPSMILHFGIGKRAARFATLFARDHRVRAIASC